MTNQSTYRGRGRPRIGDNYTPKPRRQAKSSAGETYTWGDSTTLVHQAGVIQKRKNCVYPISAEAVERVNTNVAKFGIKQSELLRRTLAAMSKAPHLLAPKLDYRQSDGRINLYAHPDLHDVVKRTATHLNTAPWRVVDAALRCLPE